MFINNLIKYIEEWAPPGASWENDNPGIQVGSGDNHIKNVFLTLDLNEKSLEQAILKKCNFIFTHHPLIFKPLKNINTGKDHKAKLIEKIIKNDLTVYSAHTNLDFTKGGVSFVLAEKLNLKNINFLVNEESNQYKVVVYVPEDFSGKVASAMFQAGSGKIGEYEKCGNFYKGIGTFEGSEFSNPAVGKKQKFETVTEIRFEVVVNKWNLDKVINAMKSVHPYEEPAYDIYPLKNKNTNFGAGAIGELNSPLSQNEFLDFICNSLKTKNLRFSKGTGKKINKVAVCGGSGSDMLYNAVAAGADAFVTADVKYHSFQDGENKILFVDAGHYETEVHSLDAVKTKIEKYFISNKVKSKVYKYSGTTNPVKFFNK
ncbi:MAG: Nif3-like dinuclear metal center hexameric protein [Bacteroidetes bacterium]|nr:Nif3-like dinuclear metal center hexameric protein [Bacteroidota bacterium]